MSRQKGQHRDESFCIEREFVAMEMMLTQGLDYYEAQDKAEEEIKGYKLAELKECWN